MNKRVLIRVFVGLFIFSVFFTLIIIISLILLFNLLRNTTSRTQDVSFDYQITEFKASSPPTFGIITTPQPLSSQEDFISYFDRDSSSSFVITNFAGSKYRCTGTCVCDNQRRSSTHVFTRSLTLLFSAFSVPMALKIAQQTLQNHCEVELEESCDISSSHTILSEVNDCKVDELLDRFESRKGSLVTEEDIEETGNRKYLCVGRCLSYMSLESGEQWQHLVGLDKDNFWSVGWERIGRCSKLVLEKEIVVTKEQAKMSLMNLQEGTRESLAELYKNTVFWGFLMTELDPFCRKTSFVEKKYLKWDEEKMNEMQERFKSGFDMMPSVDGREYCIGYSYDSKGRVKHEVQDPGCVLVE